MHRVYQFTPSLFPTHYVVEEKIAGGQFDLVYIIPERFFGLREGAILPFLVERTIARAEVAFPNANFVIIIAHLHSTSKIAYLPNVKS